jgi:hypothetical protein
MNIWALPKDATIRVALLRLSGDHDLQELALDCDTERSRQAIRICHRRIPGLSAYLFTYAQPHGRYGLQLRYPTEAPGAAPPYGPLEEIDLERLTELLSMHFELT